MRPEPRADAAKGITEGREEEVKCLAEEDLIPFPVKRKIPERVLLTVHSSEDGTNMGIGPISPTSSCSSHSTRPISDQSLRNTHLGTRYYPSVSSYTTPESHLPALGLVGPVGSPEWEMSSVLKRIQGLLPVLHDRVQRPSDLHACIPSSIPPSSTSNLLGGTSGGVEDPNSSRSSSVSSWLSEISLTRHSNDNFNLIPMTGGSCSSGLRSLPGSASREEEPIHRLVAVLEVDENRSSITEHENLITKPFSRNTERRSGRLSDLKLFRDYRRENISVPQSAAPRSTSPEFNSTNANSIPHHVSSILSGNLALNLPLNLRESVYIAYDQLLRACDRGKSPLEALLGCHIAVALHGIPHDADEFLNQSVITVLGGTADDGSVWSSSSTSTIPFLPSLLRRHRPLTGSGAELPPPSSLPSNPSSISYGSNSLRTRMWKLFLGVPIEFAVDDYLNRISEATPEFCSKIAADVPRTFRHETLYWERTSEEVMTRVLCAASVDCGYVQGMNVLLAPFLYLMPELDAYYCLHTLCRKHLITNTAKNLDGVHRAVDLAEQCLSVLDPTLSLHLETSFASTSGKSKNNNGKKLWGQIIAVRYLLTLMASVRPLSAVVRIWDMLLSTGVHSNILAFCAFLVSQRDAILATKEVYKIMKIIDQANLCVDGELIVQLTLSFISALPNDLYAELLTHS